MNKKIECKTYGNDGIPNELCCHNVEGVDDNNFLNPGKRHSNVFECNREGKENAGRMQEKKTGTNKVQSLSK